MLSLGATPRTHIFERTVLKFQAGREDPENLTIACAVCLALTQRIAGSSWAVSSGLLTSKSGIPTVKTSQAYPSLNEGETYRWIVSVGCCPQI